MCWTDYLAVASDLQLIPRVTGIDALRVAMEEVSSAPHRVQERDGLVSVLTNRTRAYGWVLVALPGASYVCVGLYTAVCACCDRNS